MKNFSCLNSFNPNKTPMRESYHYSPFTDKENEAQVSSLSLQDFPDRKW